MHLIILKLIHFLCHIRHLIILKKNIHSLCPITRILEAADRAGGLLNVPSSVSMQRVVSGGLGLEVWDLETLSDSNLIVGIKVRPVQNFIENRKSPDAGETLNCTKQRNFSVMTNDSDIVVYRGVNISFSNSVYC